VTPRSRTRPADLEAITRAASREAGGVPAELLADYLPAVLDAASTGRRLTSGELAAYGRSGQRAAETGVALRGLVDLFLSATWRLWRELPDAGGSVALRAAGLAVLRAADDAVAAAAEGFEWAHLSIARREEAERLEFFDDLLSGRSGPADLVARGERLGLRLAGPHQVILGGYAPGADPARPLGLEIDRLVSDAAAPSPSLTVTRAGRVVVMTGVTDGGEGRRIAAALAAVLRRGAPVTAPREPALREPAPRESALREPALREPALREPAPRESALREPALREPARSGQQPWRVALGRPYPGPSGVLRSYDEASDAFDLAQRLGLADPVVDAADLLVYQVLLRDRAAITDLVGALLTPLKDARGGAAPLLATLEAYYACGGVAAQAAKQLHLSVRAVTYRLARIKDLTGSDPGQPAQALALQIAVIGARLLDWPATPLESG
jgi:PucR C-terminal helix-turn-helix domain/GGDEF-like domain